MQTKPPPHDIPREEAILGAMILNPRIKPKVKQLITASDFYKEAHQHIFEALLHCESDLLEIAGYLEKNRSLDKAGGKKYLAYLVETTSTAAGFEFHCDQVKELSDRRKIISLCADTANMAWDLTREVDETLGNHKSGIRKIQADHRPDYTPNNILIDTVFKDIEARKLSGDKFVGVKTGFHNIDSHLYGLEAKTTTYLIARPSIGKAQPLDELVLTPDGFVTMGSLQVGDRVIGSQGYPVDILGVYDQGILDVYQVIFSDGSKVECCLNHLWFTQTRNERRIGVPGSVKSLQEIINTIKRPNSNSPNHKIPNIKPVEFTPPISAPTLNLDPYLLGLLIGDGGLTGKSVKFSNPEKDILERVRDTLPPGDFLNIGVDGLNHCISGGNRNSKSFTTLILEGFGLMGCKSTGKFIPKNYLMAPAADRIKLLQGLCDSDGYVNSPSGKSIEYSTSSKKLAADVIFLVRSLGGIVSCQPRNPSYNGKNKPHVSYRLIICMPENIIPISSEKHLIKWVGGKRRYYRSIVSASWVGEKHCQCIKVSAEDQLYVTSDFIPTHNTALALNIADNVSLNNPGKVLFFSLESGETALTRRRLAAKSGVYLTRIRTGGVDDSQWSHLIEAANTLSDNNLIILDRPKFKTVENLCSMAETLAMEHPISLIVVDHIQRMRSKQRFQNRHLELSYISEELTSLVSELNTPGLILCQLSREVDKRRDQRPKLSDMKESGDLEQNADNVIGLFRKDKIDEFAEIEGLKGRDVGTWKEWLSFDRFIQKFSDCADKDSSLAGVWVEDEI